MRPEERISDYYNNLSRKDITNAVNLKKSRTSTFNRDILHRATTLKINTEKAVYDSELIWESEVVSAEDELFPRKKITPFKFYFHLFEPIDWIFFIIGIIGCLATGVSKPLIYYLNSQVYSSVRNTSEQKEGATEEEIMKAKVEDTLNSNIKK